MFSEIKTKEMDGCIGVSVGPSVKRLVDG